MMKIEENLRHDSDDLFLTIARENPFAADARRELSERLREIEETIEEDPPAGDYDNQRLRRR